MILLGLLAPRHLTCPSPPSLLAVAEETPQEIEGTPEEKAAEEKAKAAFDALEDPKVVYVLEKHTI